MRGVFADFIFLPSTWSHRLADLQPKAPRRQSKTQKSPH
jgi:hypothetical protein